MRDENMKTAAGCLMALAPTLLAVPLSIAAGLASGKAWVGFAVVTVIWGMVALWLVAGMLRVAGGDGE